MTQTFRPCALIPTLDNPSTIRVTVEAARAYLDAVLVVDDASGPAGRAAVDGLVAEGMAQVWRRPVNGGKGAAVMDGLHIAERLGFSHALQIDADGQHDLRDIPRFLSAARERPNALVLGTPVFDASAPRSRRLARRISQFWVNLETGGRVIADPLCGFRVYPVQAALAARPKAQRMGHDPEVAVSLYWQGTPVVNLPTRIRYPRAEEGGVSHYHLWWDNLEMTWTHTRLCSQMLPRLAYRWLRWGRT